MYAISRSRTPEFVVQAYILGPKNVNLQDSGPQWLKFEEALGKYEDTKKLKYVRSTCKLKIQNLLFVYWWISLIFVGIKGAALSCKLTKTTLPPLMTRGCILCIKWEHSWKTQMNWVNAVTWFSCRIAFVIFLKSFTLFSVFFSENCVSWSTKDSTFKRLLSQKADSSASFGIGSVTFESNENWCIQLKSNPNLMIGVVLQFSHEL